MDDAGKLQLRKDVYGRDARMMALLKNGGNRDLENVVAHANPSYARPNGSSLPSNVAFNSDFGVRPFVLRAAVRRTADPAGPRWAAAAAAGDHPLIPAVYRRLE